MQKKIPRIKIGRTNLDVLSFSEAVDEILSLSQLCRPSFVVTPNADHVVMLEDRSDFFEAYKHADLFLCDGMPLLWASYLTHSPVKERITGADLLPGIAIRAKELGRSIFLLGAAPGVADTAARRLKEQLPGLKIAGVYCPPLGFETDDAENNRIVELINKASPDFVFVALGAPKQELWIRNNLPYFSRGVFIGVGAAVDFAAGHIRRAPKILQRLGLEWFYRWSTDPKRLTKRYLKDFRFFLIVLKQQLTQLTAN